MKSVAERPARRRAGIRDLRFHDLRHAFATDLVRNGVELPVVQKSLGHSDVRTTQRYVNLDVYDEGRAFETLCKRQEAGAGSL